MLHTFETAVAPLAERSCREAPALAFVAMMGRKYLILLRFIHQYKLFYSLVLNEKPQPAYLL